MHIAIKAIKVLGAVAALAMLSACMAQAGSEAPQREPTHHWVTQMEVSRAKYNFDNKACEEQAMLNEHTARSDPAFAAYERCMTGKGYDLATY